MSAARPTIVRGGRIVCRDQDGGRSYLRVKGLLNYIAFGHRLDRQPGELHSRGVWLDYNAQPHDHAAVVQWAKAKVHRFDHGVSYQLLLSARSGGLTNGDFVQALRQGSPVSGVHDWRFMVHADTANQHAHAMLFRPEPLTRQQYRQWQQAMQSALDRQQLAREQELALTTAQTLNSETTLARDALELSL